MIFLFSCSNNAIFNDNPQSRFDHAVELFKEKQYLKAKEEFKFLIFNNPGSKNAMNSQYYLAECLYFLEEYSLASKEYNKFIAISQDAILIKKAKFLISKCLFQLSMKYDKDQTDTKFSIEKLQNFIEEYSTKNQKIELHGQKIDLIEDGEKMIGELRNRLAKKELESGKLYMRIEEYNAAIEYFNSILIEYYDTPYNDEAIYNIISTYLLMKEFEMASNFLLSYKDDFDDKNYYLKTKNLLQVANINSISSNYIPGIMAGVYLLQFILLK